MKTKILILGRTGMLGHMVFGVLSQNASFDVDGTDPAGREGAYVFDVMRGPERLEAVCREKGGYDYFINCIGLTAGHINPEDSSSVIRAVTLNTLFPHQLATVVRKAGGRVIHMSTDGVFAGGAESYDEDAPTDCPDIYGKTKALGEVKQDNVLNVRGSIIGPSPVEGGGLFEWFRSQPDGAAVSGYTNHLWNGVTTLQFAELCEKIISLGHFTDLRQKSPVFHFTPNEPVTKYELLSVLKKVLQKDIDIQPVAHPAGEVRRRMITKFQELTSLIGTEIPMETAVRALAGRCTTAHH